MDRRGLLGAALAAVAAAAVPALAWARPRSVSARLQAMIDSGQPIIGGAYTLEWPLMVHGRSAAMRDVTITGNFPGSLIYVRRGRLDATRCDFNNDHSNGLVIEARNNSVVAWTSPGKDYKILDKIQLSGEGRGDLTKVTFGAAA